MDRAALIETLRAAVEPLTFVDAMWLGGSDAFGRADRFSDLDVSVLAPADRSDAVFDAVEGALAPIALAWRVPEPTWHGHRQRFYRLDRAGPHLFVDLTLMKPEGLEPWLHPARHGVPVVVFDRSGVLYEPPLDADPGLGARHDARLRQSVVRFRLFGRPLVERAIGRGRVVEAVWAWQGFVIAPLVEVLRALHAPDRQDFGLRYVDVDLPPAEHARLAELVLAAGLADLLEKLPRAEALFDRTVAALVVAGRLPSDGRSGTW